MRKLVLTSFKFKTGEQEYSDMSLVAVNSNGDDQADRSVAYETIERWFPKQYPESELLAVTAKNTIVADEVLEPKPKGDRPRVILEAFGADTPPPPIEEKYADYSDDVLVDLNGRRKYFAIGWYDHQDKEWRFYHNDVSMMEKKHMKWMYLPLAKYDKV